MLNKIYNIPCEVLVNIQELKQILIEKTKKNITQTEIAKALKLDKSSISVKVKRNMQITEDEKCKIEKYFNISLQNSTFNSSTEFAIPVRGNIEASMGYGVVVYNETQTATYGINRKLAYDLGISPSSSEIIFARGDSMEPTIYGGDSLLIDHSKKEIIDGLIYCIRLDEQLLIKRLQRLSCDTVGIISDNPKYRLREVNLKEAIDGFAVIGQVRWWGRIAR